MKTNIKRQRLSLLGLLLLTTPAAVQAQFTPWVGPRLVHLFLSLDDKPENRMQIWNEGTGPQYTRPSPPALITLVAGRRYYIEALHVADGSAGGLSVQWQGPGQEKEVIPGDFLSPFLVKEMKGKE
jgi:hypothetical protein